MPALPDGAARPDAPYLSVPRPFDDDHDVRPSRYYPYGTDAGGQYLLHHGVDIGNPQRTPVLAVADGLVLYAGRDDQIAWGPTTDFYGQLVVLQHAAKIDGQPMVTLYGHASRLLVSRNQSVVAGQPIAEVGAEGIALGPHLHLEVRTAPTDYGATVNPELLLRPLPGRGVIVGRAVDPGGLPAPEQPISLYHETGDWIAQTTTYPAGSVNASGAWHENFVLGDIPAGRYRVVVERDGARVSEQVTVTDGAAWVVTLVLETDATATQAPSASPTATLDPKARRPD